MPKLKTSLSAATAAGFLIQSATAASLVGYYEFEGNNNGTVGPAAINSMNPGQLSFTAGFRGQGVNISDPDAAANSGGSIDIPVDANPGVLPDVTFGGWINVNAYEFDGFMATDNGGWDRGITVNAQDSNSFGIASGAAPANAGAITPGAWQFVVGTFSAANNRSTLYVGDALASSVTTITATTVDLTVSGLSVIELGRYDNQDLNAIVDDIFVFGSELNPHEVNALRNLRLSDLDYSPAISNDLFNLFDASSNGQVGGLMWSPASGLDATNPGEVFSLGGGQYAIVLDGNGNGLLGIPEPTAPALAGLAGILLLLVRRRRD